MCSLCTTPRSPVRANGKRRWPTRAESDVPEMRGAVRPAWANWKFPGDRQRKTQVADAIGIVRINDTIAIMGQDAHPTCVWRDVVGRHHDVVNLIDHFKFPGQGPERRP